jgi:hypothetical protein
VEEKRILACSTGLRSQSAFNVAGPVVLSRLPCAKPFSDFSFRAEEHFEKLVNG